MQVEGTRRYFVIACLVSLVGYLMAPTLALCDDSTPVVLDNLQFTPTSIDTANGAVKVTVNFAASDKVSGINYFEAGFVDPSGVARRSASARLAPADSVASSVVITFPQFSNSGTW